MKTELTNLAVILLVITAIMSIPASAVTVVIDFEDLGDREYVETHYTGLTFDSGAQILQKPNYNWEDHPPYSGNNVLYSENDDIRIDFAHPVSMVMIWHTSSSYNGCIEAYDNTGGFISEACSGSVIGHHSGMGFGGSNSDLNIAYVILRSQGSFITYDDLEYETEEGPISPVPELNTGILTSIGVFGLFIASRRYSKDNI